MEVNTFGAAQGTPLEEGCTSARHADNNILFLAEEKYLVLSQPYLLIISYCVVGQFPRAAVGCRMSKGPRLPRPPAPSPQNGSPATWAEPSLRSDLA